MCVCACVCPWVCFNFPKQEGKYLSFLGFSTKGLAILLVVLG